MHCTVAARIDLVDVIKLHTNDRVTFEMLSGSMLGERTPKSEAFRSRREVPRVEKETKDD